MKYRVALVSLLLSGTLASAQAPSVCTYGGFGYVHPSREDSGFSIKIVFENDMQFPVDRNSVRPTGDWLAAQAGATIIYLASFTERRVDHGEWHGPDALTAFRSYCKTAGLDVDVPAPDLWVVSSPSTRTNTSFIVFAQPLDPDKQGWQPVQQVGAIEKALINQLPVRDGCHNKPGCAMGVSYYWLPEEGPDTLLVVAPRAGTSGWSNAPSTHLFKVHLDRSGVEIKVECLWWTSEVGPFLPDIAEDFDGDGYRDFVFSGVGYDYTPTFILSGKDGYRLLGFRGTELDVEKSVAGPKRIGVLERYDGGRIETKHEPGTSRNVFEFSKETRRFEAIKEAEMVSAQAVASPGGRPEAREDAIRKTFAAEVGGADHVRAYVLALGEHTRFQVEEVRVRSPRPSRPNPDLVKAGYQGRILFEYESPSFLKQQKAEQDRQNPGP